MSPRGEDDQAVTSRGYSAGGSLVAYPRPDEVVVPLRREEFDTLCEGGVSEEKASRGLYAGAAFGALVGLVGVLATTDWDTAWKPGHRGLFLLFLLVLCAMATGSVVGACIYQARLKRTVSNSAFSRLRTRLLGLFNEPRTLDAELENPSHHMAKQISAPSAIKWENVGNLFWLGSDLDWTGQMVKSGGPKERVLHGLTQCDHHSFQLGLADTVPGKQLSELRLEVKTLPESSLDGRRNYIATKISMIVSLLDVLLKRHQPDFRPSPEG